MIRPAKLADIQDIVAMADLSVSRNPLPVKTDLVAMAAMATSLVGNPAHFAWVAEDGGKLTACLGAQVTPGFWFRGLQSSVVMYYAATPGSGALLIRRYARWVKGRSGIKMAPFELEPGADPRLMKFLMRLGFVRQSCNLTYIRK